jgi:lipid A 3-O-deacylase PagL
LIVRHIILLVVIAQFAYAQQSAKYSYSLGAEVSNGIIHRHHEYIGHLIKGMPIGVELSLQKRTYGAKSWEANYGYPNIDFKLSYYDLKNKEQLGHVIAISSGMAFHLLGDAPFKSDLQFYFGLGVAYATKPYDKETNNLNNVISSRLSYNGNLKLEYHYQVSKGVNVGAGLKITHFSNGAVKLPNLGLNIVSVNVMSSIKISKGKPEYKAAPIVQEIDKKMRYGGIIRMGWAESSPVGSGSKPVYALGFIVQKRVSLKSLLEAGIEGFANKAVEYEVTRGHSFDGDTLDYRRIGLMFGHELVVNKLTFVSQLGVYLYRPYSPQERLYTRLGLSYYFTDKLYAGFSLKTHYAIAEVIEYSIGFRL